MRLVVCVVVGISLLLAPDPCHAAAPAPPVASKLSVGIHALDSVTFYGPRYEGGTWESRFGERLKTELEAELRAAFAKVVPLASFPPPKEAPEADEYVVLLQALARFYGRGTMNAEAHAAISVYNARRQHVKDIEASGEYTAALPAARDAQQSRFEAGVQDVVRELVGKLMTKLGDPRLQAELERSVAELRAERERPTAPPPPPPVAFGRLVLTTLPAGATVFLDEVYWGPTNAEGKLTIGGVGAGSHVVRLKMSGYQELKQRVEIAPGDNPVTLKLREAEPKPLSEAEIEDALRHEVPRPRVSALIKEYGVTFQLTKEAEIRLRDAGADNEMLLLISQSKK